MDGSHSVDIQVAARHRHGLGDKDSLESSSNVGIIEVPFLYLEVDIPFIHLPHIPIIKSIVFQPSGDQPNQPHTTMAYPTIDGVIYAPGTGPDKPKKSGSGTCLRKLCHRMAPCLQKKSTLIGVSGKSNDSPPAYSAQPSSGSSGYGYGGYGGYGSGNAFSHMMAPPPPCDSAVLYALAIKLWGGNSGHTYKAPLPPPPDDSSSDEEGDKECKGPSCPKNPKDLKHLRKIADRTKKDKMWMCWPCCLYEHGYARASKAWNKAK